MFAVNRPRTAFTMLEVFAVLLLISVLISLLLPAVQSAREMTRRTACGHQLLQLSLAIETYHQAFEQYPVQLSGTDGSRVAGADNDRRLSFLVALLPYLGQRPLAQSIGQPMLIKDLGAAQLFPLEMEFMGGAMSTDIPDESEDASMFGEAALPEFLRANAQGEAYFVAGGPEPFIESYPPWRTSIAMLRCPSDNLSTTAAFGVTNYAACLGDSVRASHCGPMKEQASGAFEIDAERQRLTEASMRGVFVPRVVTRRKDVTDGLAHTLLLGEIIGSSEKTPCSEPAIAPNAEDLQENPALAWTKRWVDLQDPNRWSAGVNMLSNSSLFAAGMHRGARWADGMPLYTSFHTILPPNAPITLAQLRDDIWGVLPPSSQHHGGVQLALADGAVRFLSDSIDSGDVTQPTVFPGSVNAPGCKSPYGVWGAMGTRSSEELAVHRAPPQAPH